MASIRKRCNKCQAQAWLFWQSMKRLSQHHAAIGNAGVMFYEALDCFMTSLR